MNNYDTSSTGDNIELSISYDNDLSSINFKSFLEGDGEYAVTRYKFGRDSSFFVIGDVNKPMYTVTKLTKMKKDELIDLDGMYQLLCPYDYAEVTKKELVDELAQVTINRYYEYITDNYSWGNISNEIIHDYYITCGYCQGDATYVVNLNKAFTKEYKQYIDNVFWDSPVRISLTVNDDDLNEYFYNLNEYEYDKDATIEVVKKLDISDNAKEWIISNIPHTPKYN